MTAPVRIRYVRSGGIGGLRMAADVDTGQRDTLAADVAARIERLSSAVLAQPADKLEKSRGRDGFVYALTFERAGKSQSLQASDPLRSQELQALIEILDGFAAPARR